MGAAAKMAAVEQKKKQTLARWPVAAAALPTQGSEKSQEDAPPIGWGGVDPPEALDRPAWDGREQGGRVQRQNFPPGENQTRRVLNPLPTHEGQLAQHQCHPLLPLNLPQLAVPIKNHVLKKGKMGEVRSCKGARKQA